jgi:hypothetical protein
VKLSYIAYAFSLSFHAKAAARKVEKALARPRDPGGFAEAAEVIQYVSVGCRGR